MGYRDHYVVDGGKARIILSTLVTPASIMDNTPMLDLVHWACAKWKLNPKSVTGDAKYGTAPNIAGLERAGMKAFVPIPDLSKRSKYYHSELFHYDAGENHYICPQGQILKRYSHRKSEQVIVYKADVQVCNSCPVKHECTDSKSGRHIFRSFFQEHVDRVRAYHDTEEYQYAMRKRGVWVEPLFGEAKQFHRLRRFRLRRLHKVNIEGLMVAAGQNLKRLLKHWTRVRVSGQIEDTGELSNLLNHLLLRWFIPLQRVCLIRFSTGCDMVRRYWPNPIRKLPTTCHVHH